MTSPVSGNKPFCSVNPRIYSLMFLCLAEADFVAATSNKWIKLKATGSITQNIDFIIIYTIEDANVLYNQLWRKWQNNHRMGQWLQSHFPHLEHMVAVVIFASLFSRYCFSSVAWLPLSVVHLYFMERYQSEEVMHVPYILLSPQLIFVAAWKHKSIRLYNNYMQRMPCPLWWLNIFIGVLR